jgi:hypothetical protein
MNIKEMQYDLRLKLNKLDSEKYKNIKVPEQDWKLNEAMHLLIKMIAVPRLDTKVGFEQTQRTIDDIRSIVVNTSGLSAVSYSSNSYLVQLPDDYMYLAGFDRIVATKGTCREVDMELIHVRQHDDNAEASPFDSSNFEWRELNVRFFEDGLRVFTDGTFSIDKVYMNYIRRPKFMHNAEDFVGGTYTALDGSVLTGTQDCELPWQVHSLIVDLAVLIITGDIQMPDMGFKQMKVKITD